MESARAARAARAAAVAAVAVAARAAAPGRGTVVVVAVVPVAAVFAAVAVAVAAVVMVVGTAKVVAVAKAGMGWAGPADSQLLPSAGMGSPEDLRGAPRQSAPRRVLPATVRRRHRVRSAPRRVLFATYHHADQSKPQTIELSNQFFVAVRVAAN